MNFLCVDIGTTSIKVGIISDSGEVVSFSDRHFNFSQNFISALWIEEFIQAVKAFGSKEFSAICVSGNGPTVCLQNGRTLLWNEKIDFSNTEKTSSLFIPRFIALKNLYPQEFEDSEKVFSGPEFFVYKLTSKAVTVLPEERFTDAYWNLRELEKFLLPKEKFPPFVKPGDLIGFLNEEFQEKLSVRKKIPVFCTGPDYISAMIGTYSVVPGAICDRSGSSEGLNFCSPVPVFDERVRTLPSVIPGLWNLSVLIEKSGILIDEFKAEIEKIENRKISYEEIIDFAFEDKNSEGWRILTEIENKISSGVAVLRELAFKNNLKINDFMTVTGGQSKNERWLLKKARGAKIKIAKPSVSYSELLGNAAVCLVGMKKYKTIQEASFSVCSISKILDFNVPVLDKLKIYKIPSKLKTIIFDIDSTLYTNSRYAFEQVDVQIRHIAEEKNISPEQFRNEVSEFRKRWKETHNGQKISLGNTFIHLGIPIEKSIQMRKELLEPEKFLQKDEKLIETIKSLKKKYKLICVTNNPLVPAKKTLRALGIEELIPDVIGLDTCKKSKPSEEPFLLACKICASECEEVLSVGDRFDMDIALPLKMGMGGILVGGVEDVYKLPEILYTKGTF